MTTSANEYECDVYGFWYEYCGYLWTLGGYSTGWVRI